MLTRLCLVRHGETDWNAARRLQGSIDIPLNAVGIKQARASASSLRRSQLHAIYSSGLQRALSTAKIIGDALALPVTVDLRLAERNFGVLQGYTQDEASARFPEIHRLVKIRDPDFCPPEGESLSHVATRVSSFMADIAKSHPGQTVLCVAHGGVLDIAHRLATDKSLSAPRDFTIGNATLNWLHHDGNRWHLDVWDQRAHLDRAIDELPI